MSEKERYIFEGTIVVTQYYIFEVESIIETADPYKKVAVPLRGSVLSRRNFLPCPSYLKFYLSELRVADISDFDRYNKSFGV